VDEDWQQWKDMREKLRGYNLGNWLSTPKNDWKWAVNNDNTVLYMKEDDIYWEHKRSTVRCGRSVGTKYETKRIQGSSIPLEVKIVEVNIERGMVNVQEIKSTQPPKGSQALPIKKTFCT
jgi:hypothetical protein